ncbi:MAG TPA: response regulator, partial [Aliidongia sp.]|nr:response regulator [Aliidongia sp.]
EQADGSITRRFGGTGLGLNICAQIVELMGGEIGMRDRQGGGSVFWIDLSISRSEAPPAPVPAEIAGRHVLILHRSEISRSCLGRALADVGMVVSEAASAEAMLDILAAHDRPADLLLLDRATLDAGGEGLETAIRRHADQYGIKRILLCSSDQKGQGWPGEAMLPMPARHQMLLQAIAHQFGAELPASFVPTAAATAAAGHGGHILVADDNAINREIALSILGGFGYSCEIARDGLETVALARRGGFDLILMDVQMPKLDGLEATRQIRALEGAVATVPIVAMTANAMQGDHDLCIAAGMNDYVSKPFEPATFLDTVARWIGLATAFAEQTVVLPQDQLPVLDQAHLETLEQVLPPDRMADLLPTYLIGAMQAAADLAAGIAADDLAGLQRIAHSITGTSGNFGARRVQMLAERLDQACRDRDMAEASRLVPAVQAASVEANDALLTWLSARVSAKAAVA